MCFSQDHGKRRGKNTTSYKSVSLKTTAAAFQLLPVQMATRFQLP